MPPPPSSLPPRVLPNLVSCSRRAVTSAATAAAAAYSTAAAAGGGGGGGRPLRYAVLGAGFAGLSVAWHLLKHSPKGSRVRVDIYDESGIGGGASGVSGGLLHPFYGRVLNSGKSVWICCVARSKRMEPLGQMELAKMRPLSGEGNSLGIIRPPTSEKTADILLESSLQSCSLQVLDSDEAQCLIPGLCVPLNFAVYMPLALNINPKKYLQVALFFACQNMSDEASLSSSEQKECKLYNEHVNDLQQLAGDYDSVIICLGARASSLPELTNKLPLRTCRGVIAEFQLPSDTIETYGSQSPSILSDAWLSFQGPRTVSIGSTWQWKSENYSSSVSDDEALNAMEELLPKASAVYPGITKWKFVQARAGIRAMPPLTANGSLPLLGCLNDVIGKRSNCSFWLVGGLGARGLLFHGLAGKLTAKAVISCDENLIPPEFTCWKEP
uniref:FAD dependent oxidoreductase domain-containing protein n=1 Tax=Oryza barthii TaxID=65489 RepID=A0A0D3GDI0_9ORYZ